MTMKILCIDDEPDILELMKEYLQLCGHQVLTALNGKDGWKILSENPASFDALITDVRMPLMSGPELVAKIHQHGFNVPVIITSGHEDKELHNIAEQYDVAAILPKPFTLSDFKEVLKNL